MSRSGTSAVGGMLAAAGWHAGAPADVVGAHGSNQRGHFENRRVLELHEAALAELDATWFDAPDADQVTRLRPGFVPRVAELVAHLAEEAAGRPIIIKDPRAGILTGLWREELDHRLLPVLVLRDPREIALSLQQRDGTPQRLGLAGWERHLRLLLAGLHGRAVTVVRYAELTADPARAAGIVAALARGLPGPLAAAVDPAAAETAIEEGLRHAVADSASAAALSPDQAALWAWLGRLPPVVTVAPPPELRIVSPQAVRGVAAERRRVDLRDATAELTARLAAVERALDATREHADGLERTREALRTENASLLEAQARLWAAVEAADRARADAERESARAAAALSVMRSSRSWRFTSPLRRSGARLRQVARPPGRRGPR